MKRITDLLFVVLILINISGCTVLNDYVHLLRDESTTVIAECITVTTDSVRDTQETVVRSENTGELFTETRQGIDYILNTNSMKFHFSYCGSAGLISKKNKLYYFGSRDELIAKGYSPCGNCHP